MVRLFPSSRWRTNIIPTLKCARRKSQLARKCARGWLVGAAAGVMAIYDYFEAERVVGARRPGSAATFRREAPKVGRNELCPCGSGGSRPLGETVASAPRA